MQNKMSYKECSNFTIEKSIIAEEACPSFPRGKNTCTKNLKIPSRLKAINIKY